MLENASAATDNQAYPVELLCLLLQGLLFELLDEIHLLEEPHLTAAQALQLPADVAVDLGLDLAGNTHHVYTCHAQCTYTCCTDCKLLFVSGKWHFWSDLFLRNSSQSPI